MEDKQGIGEGCGSIGKVVDDVMWGGILFFLLIRGQVSLPLCYLAVWVAIGRRGRGGGESRNWSWYV